MMKKSILSLLLLVAVVVMTACSSTSSVLPAGGAPSAAGSQAQGDDNPIPIEPDDMLPPFDAEAEARLASIRGEFRYPAAEVPALRIYFESVAEPSEVYTLDMPSGPSDTLYYERKLPAGTYRVFAFHSDGSGQYGGGFTTDVLCDDTSECVGGRLITVTLGEGESVDGIDLFLAAGSDSNQQIPAEPQIPDQMMAPDPLSDS